MADPFDGGHLIGHVKDADYFEVPRVLGGADGKLHRDLHLDNLPELASVPGCP